MVWQWGPQDRLQGRLWNALAVQVDDDVGAQAQGDRTSARGFILSFLKGGDDTGQQHE